jgi:protein involved in polysaccharide export with SLBB domain
MRRTLLLLLALLALAPAGRAAAQADSVFLRPGDVIHLAVFRQPELSGDFAISPEGTIQHPLLADVSVVGVPRSAIRERLRAAISRFERDPNFIFDFLYRVGVGGEVRLPNLYTLSPETTLGQAVAAAGGTTEFGRLDRVHVIRGGREMIVNLQRPDSDVSEMRIRSGDQIRVGRRSNVVRDVVGPFAAVLSAVAAIVTLATAK